MKVPNHAGIPKWLTYSTSKREALIVDVPAAMENDSEARERALLRPSSSCSLAVFQGL